MHWDPNGTRLVCDRTGDRLSDPPCGVSREFVASAVFEFVHGLHEADVALLDEIEELQTTVDVFLGDRDYEPQIGFRHLPLCPTRLRLGGGHLPVDFLQVLDWDAGMRLHDE